MLSPSLITAIPDAARASDSQPASPTYAQLKLADARCCHRFSPVQPKIRDFFTSSDAYLKLRARAGLPIPLAWRLGAFNVLLSSGETAQVKGKMAPPFAYYEGTEAGPSDGRGRRRYTLVHVTTGKPIATLRYSRDCQALGAELARTFVNGEGPDIRAGPLIERHQREAT